MRRHRLTVWAALLLCLLIPASCIHGEEAAVVDAFYTIEDFSLSAEGEEVFLCRDSTYYSGAPVYKGATKEELPGACVLHSASVLVSNLRNEPHTAQEAALANNKGFNAPRSWTSVVVWGRLAGAFSVQFASESMAEYRARLKSRGIKQPERSELMLDKLRQALEIHGDGVGLMLHFNSSGKANGGGRMHTVVLVGYIKKDGKIIDLLVNDCNVAPPGGACVRLSASTLPQSMLGERRLAGMDDAEIVTALMETVVTCRWVMNHD